MKQLFQSLKTGKTSLEELPVQQCNGSNILINSSVSLVSLGTERMILDFGKANLIDKARQQPERVKQVIEKISTDGLIPAINSIRTRLDEPLPLGYCNAGEVIDAGNKVGKFKIGDRVASNGPHAEIVSVSETLAAKIPDNVSFEEASFTVIASVALQGLRLANPTLGETCVVIGLGLVGQLAVQIAKAHGCKVIGFDLDPEKAELAGSFGAAAFSAVDPVETVNCLTNRIGADMVLITASAHGNEIIGQAAKMSRKRGRIILVGVTGLELNRADFYEKELSFQVSCSYGPGRYDPDYEKKANDYPLPFVRWTEQRNFESVLHLVGEGKLKVKPLISEIIEFDKAPELYDRLSSSKSIATLLKYPNNKLEQKRTIIIQNAGTSASPGSTPGIGLVGAGLFTKVTLLPNLIKSGAAIKTICSGTGTSATYLAKKFGIAKVTTDYNMLLEDKTIDGVIIATPHNQHSAMAIKALEAGKKVFVEKPLALNMEELASIVKAAESCGKSVTVGFNRRFAPFIVQLKKLLGTPQPLCQVVITANVGFIPQKHWVHDPAIGGGRILGEACHFIDLVSFLSGSPVEAVCASDLGGSGAATNDNVTILVKCVSGSRGTVHYFSNGSKKFPKERVEVFSQQRVFAIDNFRSLRAWGHPGFSKKVSWNQDKGHCAELAAFVGFLANNRSEPIPFKEIVNSTAATIAVVESLKKNGCWVDVLFR
jgi:predicted dehydrogenase/threonine dehydrogenase-like Zn-dependent dehydrogenase